VTETAHADAETTGLLRFIDASPSPFHAAAEAAELLRAAGFVEVNEGAAFPTEPGRYLLLRGGALAAWVTPVGARAHLPFRVVGAHTDSPNLRVKPRPDHVKAGWQMLGVQPYGGLLRNSWLDRDLSLSGRVVVRTAGGRQHRLFHDRDPVLRVAQLAIHLDRGVNEQGVVLNPQQHLVPLWGIGGSPASFAAYLGEQVGAEPADILAWDAMTHDIQPAALIGRERDLVAAPRLDNLASCHAAVCALRQAAGQVQAAGARAAYRPVVVLFDHEEVGSSSERGAASPLLPGLLERIVLAAGGDREGYWQALAASVVASADMAHGIHPNYADLHEPQHPVLVNGGPVLKVHPELRYATDAVGAAVMREACDQAGVSLQTFVVRSDLPCGSTIGPITAARLGVTTVDVGAPMLSMHSARELAGAHDQPEYAAALTAFLAPRR
jgi:aspartyl aminopeptidase